MNQIEALLSSGNKVTIFATQDSDEDTVHRKVEELDMVDLCVYSNPPTTYREGVKRTIQTFIRHPGAADTILWALRSSRPGQKLANIETYLSHEEQPFDAYHAHFGPVGEDWAFIKDIGRSGVNNPPFVVSFYGYDASSILENGSNPYLRVFDDADHITVLSEDMEETLVETGCNRDKIRHNPLGIDTDFFGYKERTKEGKTTELLIVSRFVEKKGIEYAIDALAEVRDGIDVSLTIVGDGPRREAIEKRIDDRGVGDIVNLVGIKPLSEVKKLLYDSNIFLMPCITASDGGTSPTPTILLQAQATGIPVVSTYHSGIPHIVDEGNSAILVPERDADALAEAVRSLAKQPERWPTMGRNGREFVEETHSLSALSERLVELYS